MEELLQYYPFASDTDRAVALSMFLTGAMRPALDLAPGHAIDAPVRGSGKSLMIDALSILMTGTTAPALEYSRDETEMTKRLDGMLLAGNPLIAVDNIEGVLEGAALNSTLSQHTRQVRPLGGSKMMVVPCTAMLTFTGNNLWLKGDITRRVLVARLLPDTERPELRSIPQDLRAEVRARRGELMAALHTIVAAYIAAGSPKQDLPAYGGFQQWDRAVRHALVWSGAADPLACQNKSHEDNPERETKIAVIDAWFAAFGDNPATPADACKRAVNDQALRAALAMVACSHGELVPTKLAYWLRNIRDGIAGGYTLRQSGRTKTGTKWQVLKTEVPGVHGEDGFNRRTEFRSDDVPITVQNNGNHSETSTPSSPSTPEVTYLDSEPDDELEDDLF